MTTIQPEGEDLRKATKWVTAELEYNPQADRQGLIEEACLKFDLSPLDADFLARLMRPKAKS